MASNKFISLIETTAREIKDDYKAAQDHARGGDPQRAGHEGEAVWASLIRKWFPVGEVLTRKYIVGPGGETNEVDIVLVKRDYPRGLMDQPSVLVSGVAAAFSCKLTLKRSDIMEAIEQKRRINSAAGDAGGLWPDVMTGPVPFGLLSQSTSLLKSSTNFSSGFRRLYDEIVHPISGPVVLHPKEELDAVLIADRGFWSTMYHSLAQMPHSAGEFKTIPTTVFLEHSPGKALPGYPLVQFLSWLSSRSDHQDKPSLAALYSIFGLDQQSGSPVSWDLSIYPDHIRQNLHTLINDYGLGKTA